MLKRVSVRLRPATAFGFACLGLALAAGAAAEDPEGWAYALSREMMSPFCPGRSLSDCPSTEAESLRMWILVQDAAGRQRSEVEAELLDRYGDVILAAPRAQGFGWAAYLLPAVVFVAGGILLGVFLRTQTRTSHGLVPDALDPDLSRRVDEELRRSGARPGSTA